MRSDWIKHGMLATVLAAGLIAAGCGSDDDGDEISREDFIVQANAICASGDEEIEAATEETFEGEPSDEEVAELITGVLVPLVQDQVEQIRALGAPAGDEDEVDAILDAAEEGLEQGREDPELFLTEDGPPGLDEASRLAEDYGLEECAD